jgi:hypothetical protein
MLAFSTAPKSGKYASLAHGKPEWHSGMAYRTLQSQKHFRLASAVEDPEFDAQCMLPTFRTSSSNACDRTEPPYRHTDVIDCASNQYLQCRWTDKNRLYLCVYRARTCNGCPHLLANPLDAGPLYRCRSIECFHYDSMSAPQSPRSPLRHRQCSYLADPS